MSRGRIKSARYKRLKEKADFVGTPRETRSVTYITAFSSLPPSSCFPLRPILHSPSYFLFARPPYNLAGLLHTADST